MKTSRRMRSWAFVAPLLGLQGLAACLEKSDGDLVIQQAQPIKADGESCVANTDEQNYLSHGTVDMAVARNYEMFPLVRNNMADITATKGYSIRDARLNTKNVSLRKATITYHTQEEFSVRLGDRTVPLAASVSTGGKTTVSVELLTPSMIEQFRNSKEFIVIGSQGEVRPARSSIDLVVGLTIDGETQDGNKVESNEFEFSVRVCNGCLVFYPPDATSDEGPAPNCLAPPDTTSDDTLCAIGWERPIHCGLCTSFAPDPLARQLCQPTL